MANRFAPRHPEQRPQAWHAIELYGSAETVKEPL